MITPYRPAKIVGATGRTNCRLSDLPNTVGKLATAISEMRDIFDHRLTSLESQQSENTGQLNSIQQTLNTLDGRVANTTGSDYERSATRRVPSLLSRYLRLSRIQALHSPLQETAPFLVEMINNALTAHDITDSEADDLEQADIIVYTQRRRRPYVPRRRGFRNHRRHRHRPRP